MKIKKYIVETFLKNKGVGLPFGRSRFDSLDEAINAEWDNGMFASKYVGYKEVELFCECCDRDLTPDDTYIVIDQDARYCDDCYEEESLTSYTVGGEFVGDDNSILSEF